MSRNDTYNRLIQDLMGPKSDDEVLTDRPTQRYSTGILYPVDLPFEAEEDADAMGASNEDEDAAAGADDGSVSLLSSHKPSVAGISFAVQPIAANPSIKVEVKCATYALFNVDAEGKEAEGKPKTRAAERWRRNGFTENVEVQIREGDQNIVLGTKGLEDLNLYVLVVKKMDLLTITLALTNRRKRGGSREFDEEQHFFQVQLNCFDPTGCTIAPRPSVKSAIDEDSRISALIYRNEKEYVVGHTCSARAILKEDVVQRLESSWIPETTVKSMSDRGDEVFDKISGQEADSPLSAKWLAECNKAQLLSSLGALVTCYNEWIRKEELRVPTVPKSLQAQAKSNLKRCFEGSERMAEAVEIIKTNDHALTSFQLAQEAMNRQYGWSRKGAVLRWRPFQLGFQLLSLASLVDRGHKDRSTMDLLWFPTGGGKTEAYLAIIAFSTFFRRISQRGERDGEGVVALMRYTLRLLTIQQFQRAAAMISACELIRVRNQISGKGPNLGKTPIGIGLWVGQAATPTTLKEAMENPPNHPSRPEQLSTCPCCEKPLKWRIDSKESSVTCPTGSACELSNELKKLPVWTIDEEIYKHTPALVVGTVDKFAQIVRNPGTGVLFGLSTKSLPPDLIIQDELHLISGPLGTVAGLYEVAINELCSNMGWPPKIIGSTATIRRAAEQARFLFDRETYQFPAPGLDASNSGFAKTDDKSDGRMYVGVTTAGRSATYMLQAIAASMLQSAVPMAPPHQDYYWSLVVYFNSLKELGRALVLMQDDVPFSAKQYAVRRGESPRKLGVPAELTSRRRSYEIRDMLDQLKKQAGDPEAVDMLLASNMISVGMDIPRLGAMLVNAQPKTLSEYIQATSRVGRNKVPGIVVTMYNNTRARDRSRYETFETWHRSLYRDVEATSVTPFASRAQDKAIHAVLVALARHLVNGLSKSPLLDDHKKAAVEKLAIIIEQRVARVDPAERVAVSNKLKHLIDQWAMRTDLESYWDDYGKKISLLMSAEQFAAKVSAEGGGDPEGTSRALWPTPNSMREVEPGVPFTLRRILKAEDNNGQS